MAENEAPMTPGAGSAADEASSRQIQADIDRTRAHMDRTFDALESKLTPGQLLQEGWGLLKGGSGAGARKVFAIAREHPLPAAVIGLGLGLLVLDSNRQDRERRGDGRGYGYGRDYDRRYGYAGSPDYPAPATRATAAIAPPASPTRRAVWATWPTRRRTGRATSPARPGRR